MKKGKFSAAAKITIFEHNKLIRSCRLQSLI